MAIEYVVHCFNCVSDFDALEAVWCSCNPQNPTKVCPFCMGCFCAAGEEFKTRFWKEAPQLLRADVATLDQARMLIGDRLVRAGLITTPQLLDALKQQKVSGKKIGEVLVESGVLPIERLQSFLKTQHTVPPVDIACARIDALMLTRLGVQRCLRERILPLETEAFRDRNIMTLVMADPSDTATLERVIDSTGYQVIPGVAPADRILDAIRAIFPEGTSATGISGPG